MHTLLPYILFGVLSFSYFVLLVSTDLERKLFTISYIHSDNTGIFHFILFDSLIFSIIIQKNSITNSGSHNQIVLFKQHPTRV